MKKHFLILLLICLFVNSRSQAFQWAKSIGAGTNPDIGKAIIADNNGNSYITGHFHDYVNFGVWIDYMDGAAFVLKSDHAGNFVSVTQFGGPTAIGTCIRRDASGNVYVAGTFTATADFDPGPAVFNLSPTGNRDIFILKLNSIGIFQWAKSFACTGEMDITSMALDTNNNVFTTGYFQGSADFDPGAANFSLTAVGVDLFISKLNAAGDFVWAHKIGNTGNEFSFSMALDNSGNVFTTGSFENTADFDPGAGVTNLTANGAGIPDIFVLKLDNAGNYAWAKQMGGANTQEGKNIALDASGNIFISGEFYFNGDFDPGPAVYNMTAVGPGNKNLFVSRLDVNGNLVWAKQIAAAFSQALATDNAGNVFTAGTFVDTVDFDPGPGVYNLVSDQSGFYEDMYISKLGGSGNFLMAESISGSQTEVPCSIFVDANNNMYTTGYFDQQADFDPGPAVYYLYPWAISSPDIFIARYNYCGQASAFTLTDTACNSYTLNGQTYGASGSFTQIIANAIGCDSVITLNLTINAVNAGVAQAGANLSALATGAAYQWLTCNPYQVIPGETNPTFNAMANGDYAVVVTQNGCTDTSACYPVSGIAVPEIESTVDLIIYPNPVIDVLYISYNFVPHKNARIQISDLYGRVVMETDLPSNTTQVSFPLKDLPAGVFTFKILNDEVLIKAGKLLLH